jgi:hypothetical protein
MTDNKYNQSVENLCKAIDIAVSVLQEYPPKEFNTSHIANFVNTYLDFKNRAENPEPQFQNLKSLNYIINDVFIYFQEGSGDAVNAFWNKIKELNLPFKRENKLAKILKRKKINNKIEFDFIIDVLVPYQQEKLIDKDDVDLLNKLITEFELSKKDKRSI